MKNRDQVISALREGLKSTLQMVGSGSPGDLERFAEDISQDLAGLFAGGNKFLREELEAQIKTVAAIHQVRVRRQNRALMIKIVESLIKVAILAL